MRQLSYEEMIRHYFLIDPKFFRRKRTTRLIVPIALCTIIGLLILYPIIQNSHGTSEEEAANYVVVNHHTKVMAPNGTNLVVRRFPQVLIIGTRKSGTRALLRFLEINPAVRSAHREVHFFDRDTNYNLGLGWYRGQMPATNSQEITIEKSPAYFVTREAPERIKAMNASIKLVVILRNPVTRLISDFSQTIANRIEVPSSLDDYYEHDYSKLAKSGSSGKSDNATSIWMAAERELRRHVLRPDGGIDDQRRIVRIGMYSSHLERWFSVFPRDQFHFVDGERLIERPHVELRKLERFIGLSPAVIKESDFVFSRKKGFYCVANQTMLSEEREREGESTDDESAPGLMCLGKGKGRRHVGVGQELRDKLKNFYAPFNDYLESMTGLNFNV